MQTKALTHYSSSLGKDMHMMIYGHSGIPFLAFPTQDGMCRQYEEFGLIDQIREYIEDGRIQLFVVDTVDTESWSLRDGSREQRAERQEQYFRYLVEQVVPLIREENDALPYTMGMSMGADHAAITFLRRPELFRGVLALSGVSYINLYNQKKLVFCVGQGAWEEDGVRTLRHLQRVFESKGIHAWCDFWGYDVNHDWPWWFRQIRYFLPFLLEG